MENKNVDITKKSVVTADITDGREVTCVEWFHGYGGNALGLKRAIPGLRSVAVCERDAFVVANMVSKMEKGLLDSVPIWTDVTDFPTEPFGCGALDLFIASYPCQGFSHAGKRLGVDDHRHLWPHCRKFIGAVRPRYVWLENVEGHVSLGLPTVLADLEEDGYTAAWGIFSASEVGAPHQRKRVFILAQRIDTGFQGGPESVEGRAEHQRHNGDILRSGLESGGEDVAHHHHQGLQGVRERGGQTGREIADGHAGGDSQVWPSHPGASQYGWEPPRVVCDGRQRVDNSVRGGLEREGAVESRGQASDLAGEGIVENLVQQRVQRGPGQPGGNDGSGSDGETALPGGRSEDRGTDISQTQPPLGGNADGLAAGLDFPGCTGLSDTELEEIYGWMVKGTNRTDELRMCGNGVVPQTAERAFRTLFAKIKGHAGTDVSIMKD